MTAVAIAAACVVNALALTFLGMWGSAASLNFGDWALLCLYLSLFCTFFGYTFWYVALKADSTAKVTITIFMQPIFGILIAWLWLSEIPTPWQLAGTLVILVAVGIVVIRPRGLSMTPSSGFSSASVTGRR